MTKQKSTKRALLLSALSLLMCVSMLIGSTFAWFTDSVTSSGNIIKSGTLDVTMEWADGTKAVPADDSNEWTDASKGAIFNSELWEPGYTEVRHIKIANEGTLALKYQLNIIANGEVSKLADVIDVYYVDPAVQVADRTALTDANKLGTLTDVLANISTTASGNLKAGDKDTITLALKMQESAGNEYQDLAIGSDFSIQLLATQLTSESDNFNNQYDADATLGTYIELNAGEDLLAAMASAEAGMPLTIKLNGNVEWPTAGHNGEDNITPASSILIDGNGYTITATGAGVTPLGDTEAPMTLKNVKIADKSVSYAEGAWEFSYLEMGGKVLNCINVDFSDPIMVESDSANFVDCSFVGYRDDANSINMNGVWMANGDATFTNCTFTGTRGMKICDMYAPEIGTVVIDGCTFMDLTQKPGVAIDDEDTQDMKITIKNSTFINCQPGDQGLYIYETDNTVPTVENNKVYNNAKFVGSTAELIALGGTNVEGVLILTDDIDLNGAELKTIGVTYNKSLEIVGNGHKISNAKIATGKQNGMTNMGMFYVETGASFTVSDLTVNGMTVAEGIDDYTIGAALIGYANQDSVVTLNNVDVNGASINNTKGNAAIYVGYTVATVNMNGCDIGSDCTVNGERADKTGAFVGTANTAGCVVTVIDCTNGTSVADYGRVIGGATYN